MLQMPRTVFNHFYYYQRIPRTTSTLTEASALHIALIVSDVCGKELAHTKIDLFC